MDDTTRRMTEPDTEEIRSEIEQKREEMAETIDAIQEKLRPRRIVAEARDRVKTATTERLRAMAETAEDAAYTVKERTRETAGGFLESLRENPYPAALIGAGIAWWIASSRRERDWAYGRGDYDWQRRRSRGYDYSEEGDEDTSMVEDVAERSREYIEGARGYMRESSQTLQRTGRMAQDRFDRMLHENPLLVGAGALLLGVAFGMAVPETDQENEWLGETRDAVVERAQQMAGDAATRVQETASDVASAASKIAESVTSKPQGGRSQG